MTFRRRFLLSWGGWIALVTALLVGLPVAFRNRVPHPMAVHWGISGAPNNSMPLWGMVATTLGLWAVFAGMAGAMARRGGIARRPARSSTGAALAGMGVFVLGLLLLTLWANLDIVTWRDARSITWQVFALIGCSVLAGWGGWRLARPGPGDTPQPSAATAIRLHTGERAVWVSSAANPVLQVLGGVALALALGMTVGAALLRPSWWLQAGVSGLVGVALMAFSSVRAHVSESGLRIDCSFLRLPLRRIPLAKIHSARAENRKPFAVGGWGYRGLPGNATIMIRGGECLVIRYVSGGELGVSVDDAERGAALVNALTSGRH